ncbi:MAG: nodulation protein NfeD, partial [Bacteroidales bacterium]|nr:nodulation protein NfeD [Bacteroidales bacterium]
NMLIHPAVSGILIMIIIGGLYFEIQTPGIGFPLAASVFAALLYFAPLYLEGIASNWEVLIFVLGVILLLVEIFAIPGFGVAGITGLALIIAGLSFAMVDTVGDNLLSVNYIVLAKAFFTVIIAVFSSLILSLYFSKKLFSTNRFGHLALDTVQNTLEGFTSADQGYTDMIGKNGRTFSILRPSGKVIIDHEMYDATAVSGYIDADTEVVVLNYQTGQLIVRKT